jgi:hypothetical protein
MHKELAFDFPSVMPAPAGDLSYQNIITYLETAVNLLNTKYKSVKIDPTTLEKKVASGEVSQAQADTINTGKYSIHEKSILLWKKVEQKPDYTSEMKENIFFLINKIRVIIYLPMLKAGGEMETDEKKSKEFFSKVTSGT